MGNKIASKDYDIIITDPALTEHGFTRFSLPLNGNASVMVVHNIDKSKMMYPTFYKSDLDKTVQSLREKISSDGILIDDDTADSLVRYFRNECISLSEDKHSEFFKNGNGNGNNSIKNEENETNCNYAIAESTVRIMILMHTGLEVNGETTCRHRRRTKRKNKTSI
jgi:hypothetical protein